MRAVSVAALALVASQAPAAESFTGRWGVDSSACAAIGPFAGAVRFTATETRLYWADKACRIGKIYRIGEAVHIQAHCDGPGPPTDIPVRLAPRGERMLLTWGDQPAKEMRRCR